MLKPLSTIFQLYRGGQYIMMEKTGVPGENWNTWRKPEYRIPGETTD